MARKKLNSAEIFKRIDKQLDTAMGKILIETQSRVSEASPVLTGRLASSWFIGKNVPDASEPPESPWNKWKKGDPPIFRTKEFNEPIKFEGKWYISSNLPYSYRAAFDPYNGRVGAGDWFTRIQNDLPSYADSVFQKYLGKI